ncbi:MAG: dTDP-4-dehydrorhamnose reductase [Nitrospinales bacterium]
MKILILGSRGMLGHDLLRAFANSGHETVGAERTDLDITDARAVSRFIQHSRPRWVILAAAYTRVDDCESNRDRAFAVNAQGPKHVAVACREANAGLCFVSTDYVFDGGKNSPYTEEDSANPQNVYGESKLAGEKNVQEFSDEFLIVRSSWLYGLHGRNFVETILAKAQSQPELKVVDDQVGAPTWTVDLAAGIVSLVEKGTGGIVHVTNAGNCSWHEFAEKILELNGVRGVAVRPVSSAQFQAPARRPACSRLALERFRKLTGHALQPWPQALAQYLQERKKQVETGKFFPAGRNE